MADDPSVAPTAAPQADAPEDPTLADLGQGTATPEDGLCFESGELKIFEAFDDMDLPRDLLRGIYSNGFERPSAIQQRAIVPVTQGGDVIAQAPSGTGKTGAFTIGALQRIDPSLAACQALILSPTRELAMQTNDVVSAIGRFLMPDSGRKVSHVFVGGTQLRDDLRIAQSGFAVAVGTPGRVNDVVERGALRMENLKLIILDEADDLLGRGFQDQIHDLFRFLPKDIQVCLFSATMPDMVLELTKKFMRNPTSILVKKEQLTLEGIRQFYVRVEDEFKASTLKDLYKHASVAQSVIFCNSRRRVDWLQQRMSSEGHVVAAVHSEMDRPARMSVMEAFKAGRMRVLITTDLLARGIDVHHVSIVINFDLPTDKEQYLHRIGRGGRYGRKGVAINFVTSAEKEELDELQRFYAVKIAELPQDFQKFLEAK